MTAQGMPLREDPLAGLRPKAGSPVLREQDAPEWLPTFTLDSQISRARHEMGEARWNQLNSEWENSL